jgi:hypothetical protein
MKSSDIKSASVNASKLFRKLRPAAAERRAKNDSFLSFDDEESFDHVSSKKRAYFNFKVGRWTKECFKEITDKHQRDEHRAVFRGGPLLFHQ